MNNEELVTFCFPTCEFKEGLLHNLEILSNCKHKGRFKIVISDDSSERLIGEDELIGLKKQFGNKILYSFNAQALGAHGNWNKLIRECKTRYVLLMHHDEIFSDTCDLELLLESIYEYKTVNTFILKHHCYIDGNRAINMMPPGWVKACFLYCIPEVLIFYNFIGPPSAIVTSRKDPLYDTSLKNLVDVDYYLRIFKVKGLRFVNCRIESIDNPGSITRSLGKEIKRITADETGYLLRKYNISHIYKFSMRTAWIILLCIKFYKLCMVKIWRHRYG